MSAQKYAGAVTVPFAPTEQREASLKRAFRELLTLRNSGIERVYVLVDRRSKCRPLAQKAVHAVEKEFMEKEVDLQVIEVDAFETAQRWRFGIQQAIADGFDAAFLFPGDMETDPTERNRQGWRDMLAAVRQTPGESRGLLVVGDYVSVDAFKETLDRVYLRPLLAALHGAEAMDWVASLGITKLRTEFFVVTPSVYRDLEDEGIVTWSSDPTPQLLLFAHRHPEACRVSRVDIGPFHDNDDTRKPLGQFYQVFRFFAAQVTDRLYTGMKSARADANGSSSVCRELAVCERLFPQVENAWHVMLHAGRENLLKLRGPLVKERVQRASDARAEDNPGVSLITNYGAASSQAFRKATDRVVGRLEDLLRRFPDVRNAGALEIVSDTVRHVSLIGLEAEGGRSVWMRKKKARDGQSGSCPCERLPEPFLTDRLG